MLHSHTKPMQCMKLSKLPPIFAVRTLNNEKKMMSPPGAQIVEEEEDDNFSNHSRTCQQAIALFLLLFLLLWIFCWIALLLDGTLF